MKSIARLERQLQQRPKGSSGSMAASHQSPLKVS
jgi:hypothetical protein